MEASTQQPTEAHSQQSTEAHSQQSTEVGTQNTSPSLASHFVQNFRRSRRQRGLEPDSVENTTGVAQQVHGNLSNFGGTQRSLSPEQVQRTPPPPKLILSKFSVLPPPQKPIYLSLLPN